jgi:peptidoglycan/xylan/chitin deacetylase (PgdA/CDA1 family)
MAALILMYHDIANSVAGVAPAHRPYVLEPAVFHRQMKFAAASRLSCLLAKDWVGTAAKPARALVITFDDGHVSNFHLALPVLAELGLKATFFATAGAVGSGETMTWAQLRALHGAGMEIGSHTLTHRPPSTLGDPELRYELSESRRVLEDGLGAPVTSISSPTGFFNPRMRDLAREAGYTALCFGRVGLAEAAGDPFALNRVAVKRSLSETRFRALLDFDPGILRRMRLRQWALERARALMSVDAYLRLRRALMRSGAVEA